MGWVAWGAGFSLTVHLPAPLYLYNVALLSIRTTLPKCAGTAAASDAGGKLRYMAKRHMATTAHTGHAVEPREMRNDATLKSASSAPTRLRLRSRKL